jgi:hypothetical protein
VKLQLLLHFIIGSIIITLLPASALAQDFPDVCQGPENILANCGFNNGLDQWQTFTEDGGANISVLQGGGGCHAPLCPAAYIVVEDSFVGGLLQQVPVAKGNTYYANVVWLVFDSLTNDAAVYNASGGIGRRVGIDPFGGTDPHSSNIIWGPDVWRNDCKICNVEQVTATAQADTITVFLRLEDTWRRRVAEKGFNVPPSKDQFWIDDLGLKQVDGSQVAEVAQAEPPPTDTPEPPPTDTPEPVSPTEPPTVEAPTDTPETAAETPASPTETTDEIAQLESAEIQPESPLPTPAAISKIAPPPTLTPSPTRPPTDTPEPATATPIRPPVPTIPASIRDSGPPVLSAGLLGVVGTTACIGGLGLVLMGAVLAGLVWLYRLGWGQIDDDDFEDDEDFDDDEVIVEIVE